MKWDLIRALVDKEFKEFKKNKYVFFSIAAFPILMSIILPLSTVAPFYFLGEDLTGDVDPGQPLEIKTVMAANQTVIDDWKANLTGRETLLLDGYHIKGVSIKNVFIMNCIVEDSFVQDSVVHGSNLDNVTLIETKVTESWIEDSLVKWGEVFDSRGRDVELFELTAYGENTFDNPGDEEVEMVVGIISGMLLMVFILLPAVTPTFIASFSIIGEKKARSLEPMLATPISDMELLTGKVLSAFIPTMIATYGGFAIFAFLMHIFSVPVFGYNIALTPSMLLGLFLLAPFVGLLSIEANVLISSKMNDIRAAQQVGGLIVLPLILLFMVPMSGLMMVGPMMILVLAIIVAVIDLGVLKLNAKVFNRENILVKWSG